MSQPEVGLVGLGRMGSAMAVPLLHRFGSVGAWNRTRRVEVAESVHVDHAERVDQLFGQVEVIVSCLADDAAVLEVFSEENCKLLRRGDSVVEMSTVSPRTMELLARRLTPHGVHVIDAPVFGGPGEAARGELVIPYSGDVQTVLVKTVLDALASHQFNFGRHVGAASSVKLSGNSIVIGTMGLLAEAFHQVATAGSDAETFSKMLKHVDFASPVLAARAEAMAAGSYASGFALASVVKDLRLIRECGVAAESGLQAEVLELFYRALLSRGPDADIAELFEVLRGKDV